jgi:hypothetical protein
VYRFVKEATTQYGSVWGQTVGNEPASRRSCVESRVLARAVDLVLGGKSQVAIEVLVMRLIALRMADADGNWEFASFVRSPLVEREGVVTSSVRKRAFASWKLANKGSKKPGKGGKGGQRKKKRGKKGSASPSSSSDS